MNLILKYKGKEVVDLGPADMYMMESSFQKPDYIDNAAENALVYIQKRITSLVSATHKYENLHKATDDADDMLVDFMDSCESFGRMYMLAAILENEDFDVEVE